MVRQIPDHPLTRDPRKQAIALNLIATERPIALPWQVGCEFIAASRKLASVGFTEAKAWARMIDALSLINPYAGTPDPSPP